MLEVSNVIAEDVNASIVMTTRRHLAIGAQIHTQAKAARSSTPSVVFLHNLFALNIPHVYSSIVRRASKVLFLTVQRNCPDITGALRLGLRGCNLRIQGPVASGRVAAPYLDVTTEANTCCNTAGAAARGCRDVMCAQLVGCEGLGDGEGTAGVGRAVDVDCG